MASVAVITPTRNMADTLWVSLGSACRAGADEIVVIDDASEDHTPAVVGLWQARYPQIKYIRHDTKLPDHNAAQREVYASLKSDYVIGLSADDLLYSNCIREIREAAENGEPAVVFTGVDVLQDGEHYIRTDIAPVSAHMTPEAVSTRFRSDANATESGIGSALRHDMAMWLWSLGWESLGPCMDSVGYGTVACLQGAAYIHKRCAALAFRERSYGRNPDWNEDYYLEIARKSIDFMFRAGLDRDTAAAICKKRCRVEVSWED